MKWNPQKLASKFHKKTEFFTTKWWNILKCANPHILKYKCFEMVRIDTISIKKGLGATFSTFWNILSFIWRYIVNASQFNVTRDEHHLPSLKLAMLLNIQARIRTCIQRLPARIPFLGACLTIRPPRDVRICLIFNV